jgi:hypothetical protein
MHAPRLEGSSVRTSVHKCAAHLDDVPLPIWRGAGSSADGSEVAVRRRKGQGRRVARAPRRQAPIHARSRALSVAALLFGAAFAVGCGRPATEAECTEIFDKSAELELRAQGLTDPAVIAERTTAVRTARGADLVQKCVGRSITTRAMTCIREAKAPSDVDQCLY